MSVTTYRSSDGSAPVLTGQNGTLITLLDACLVNGYGAKAAAGWAKPFSGTNLAAYRGPTAPGSPGEANRRYLRVDDSLATTYIASVLVFDTMSSIDVGTNRFPSVAQNSGKTYVRKSVTSNATARPWTLIASDRAFYLFIAGGSTVYAATTNEDTGFFFGDFISYVPGDTFNTALLSNTSTTATGAISLFGKKQTAQIFVGDLGRFIRAPWHGLGGAVPLSLTTRDFFSFSVLGYTSAGADYPDPIRGGLVLNYVEVLEGVTTGSQVRNMTRGRLPGLYASENKDAPGTFYDTMDATNDLVGRQLMAIPVYNLTTPGRVYLEISDTWW